jgi:hypothetical protein
MAFINWGTAYYQHIDSNPFLHQPQLTNIASLVNPWSMSIFILILIVDSIITYCDKKPYTGFLSEYW